MAFIKTGNLKPTNIAKGNITAKLQLKENLHPGNPNNTAAKNMSANPSLGGQQNVSPMVNIPVVPNPVLPVPKKTTDKK